MVLRKGLCLWLCCVFIATPLALPKGFSSPSLQQHLATSSAFTEKEISGVDALFLGIGPLFIGLSFYSIFCHSFSGAAYKKAIKSFLMALLFSLFFFYGCSSFHAQYPDIQTAYSEEKIDCLIEISLTDSNLKRRQDAMTGILNHLYYGDLNGTLLLQKFLAHLEKQEPMNRRKKLIQTIRQAMLSKKEWNRDEISKKIVAVYQLEGMLYVEHLQLEEAKKRIDAILQKQLVWQKIATQTKKQLIEEAQKISDPQTPLNEKVVIALRQLKQYKAVGLAFIVSSWDQIPPAKLLLLKKAMSKLFYYQVPADKRDIAILHDVLFFQVQLLVRYPQRGTLANFESLVLFSETLKRALIRFHVVDVKYKELIIQALLLLTQRYPLMRKENQVKIKQWLYELTQIITEIPMAYHEKRDENKKAHPFFRGISLPCKAAYLIGSSL